MRVWVLGRLSCAVRLIPYGLTLLIIFAKALGTGRIKHLIGPVNAENPEAMALLCIYQRFINSLWLVLWAPPDNHMPLCLSESYEYDTKEGKKTITDSTGRMSVFHTCKNAIINEDISISLENKFEYPNWTMQISPWIRKPWIQKRNREGVPALLFTLRSG
jgi:hypothetical protein